MDIHAIVKGSEQFKKDKYKKYQHKFVALAKEGQNPKILFIGCCDSRVLPNMITNTGPGDLFVMRNIGNFVPPYKPDEEFHATAAAIEYAVSVLEVEDIIVCGHSQCGAIASLYKTEKLEDPALIHVKKWLELGMDAKSFVTGHLSEDVAKEDKLNVTEKVSAIIQIDNLMTYPVVRERVEEGKLFLNAWHYDIASGEIAYYDSHSQEFVPLNAV
ncbi:MAG: carbonic anhydrase [Sulfurospirillum sp.]|nr:MAG: carbonic anhydrase [Sulfurospirillum sp.]